LWASFFGGATILQTANAKCMSVKSLELEQSGSPWCEHRITNLTTSNSLSICLSKVAAIEENQGFCGSFPFTASASPRCAGNSVHKLATNFWASF
jgi:hypothetical protein